MNRQSVSSSSTALAAVAMSSLGGADTMRIKRSEAELIDKMR